MTRRDETRSALYEGAVWHNRLGPVAHSFTTQIALAYLDLEELECNGHLSQLLASRHGLVGYERSDYLGDERLPLSVEVRRIVHEQTGMWPRGPIRLLTNLRSLGWNFNPISLYYCFAPNGDDLEAVAFEVTNTPWGERATYAATIGENPGCDGIDEAVFDKALHVSPFLPMDLLYRFSATTPAATCRVAFTLERDDSVVFEARLEMTRWGSFERPGVRRMARRHPFMPLKVSASIYLQAARLALKGAPFHPHPPRAHSTERVSRAARSSR